MPLFQGVVEHYSFLVSIDEGLPMRYTIPNFDTGLKHYFVPLNLTLGKQISPDVPDLGVTEGLEPHTVTITSIASTPFSFEGLSMENTQIQQGNGWKELQLERPVIEFVGEGVDGERAGGFFGTMQHTQKSVDAIITTVQYKLGQRLGIEHSHMSANVCLLSNCDFRKMPGLETQYFQVSPIYSSGRPTMVNKDDPHNLDNLKSLYQFPEYSSQRSFLFNPVTHVVVDTGVLDILVNKQNPDDYSHALARFLLRIRNVAHPRAKILVIGRKGSPPSGFASRKASGKRRGALYAATKSAVKAIGDPDTVFVPLRMRSGEALEVSYLRVLCPYIIPRTNILTKTKAIFQSSDQVITKAQIECLAVSQDLVKKNATGACFWMVAMVISLAGLWVAKGMVLGVLAAIVGKLRAVVMAARSRLAVMTEGMRFLPRDESLEVEKGRNGVKLG
jgi:hypothetical protein